MSKTYNATVTVAERIAEGYTIHNIAGRDCLVQYSAENWSTSIHPMTDDGYFSRNDALGIVNAARDSGYQARERTLTSGITGIEVLGNVFTGEVYC
jgi:hypothetical protein